MAQISKGHQYEPTGDNSQVTHENLNAHVDNATLLNGAIVEQDLVTFANNEDLLLISQGGVLASITKNNLISIGDFPNGYLNFGAGIYQNGVSAKVGNDGLIVESRDGIHTPVRHFSIQSAGSFTPLNETGVVTANRIYIANDNPETFGTVWGNRLELAHGTKLVIHGRDRTDDFTPAGTVVAFAGQTAPTGWLVCDGRTLDATDTTNNPVYDQNGTPVSFLYKLWSVIGTTYGGTGQSSFKIPDLRGEFIRGYDHGNGADPRTFGSSQKDLLKAHKHIASNNDCQNYAGVNGTGTGNYNAWCDTNGVGSGAGAALTGDGQHPEQIVLGVPTVGHETRPRNIALNYIIKY